jgi:hypothetical protein
MAPVSARDVHLRVDVTIDGPMISGRVSAGTTFGRNFSGRLGLISAIEDALATPSSAHDIDAAPDLGEDHPTDHNQTEAPPWRAPGGS